MTVFGSISELKGMKSLPNPISEEQAIIHHPQELTRNGDGDILQPDRLQVKVTPNSSDKKLFDFKSDDPKIKLKLFDGPSGIEKMERLEHTQELIDSISRRKTELASREVRSFGNQWGVLHVKEEHEYTLQALRGRLSDLIDKKDFTLDDPLWNEMTHNIQAISKPIRELELEVQKFKKKSEGFFGRLYSIWKYLFDYQTWQRQIFTQSLRRIRIELRNRPPTMQEHIVLQLEKIGAAGFPITRKEVRLAEKISKSSEVVTNMNLPSIRTLSTNEESLLKEISRRTIPVRREEQAEELVRKLAKAPKGSELFRNNPRDFHLIENALRELASKEREGKVWTPAERDLLADLMIESRGLGKRRSKLGRILANLKKRKALVVLQAGAHSQMQGMEQLKLKLEEFGRITHEEMAEVTKLAEQYYRLKEQADTPLHLDIIRVAREQLQKKALSKENRAILVLDDLKERNRLDDGQKKLLEKLQEASPAVDIPEEGKQMVREHVEMLMKIHPLEKAQAFDAALRATPEFVDILQTRKLTKAQFFEEVVSSRPAVEWWTELSAKMKEGPHEELATAGKFLTFAERCQVLVLSTRLFRVLPTRHPSLEHLALERLVNLAQIKRLTEPELKLRIGLTESDFGMINTPQAKRMIRNLATEETLVNNCKASIADQKLVLRLAQNVDIGQLDQEARQKLDYLFPEELNQLGDLISRDDADEKFREATKFSQIMELLEQASNRIKLEPYLSDRDDLLKFLEWDATRPRHALAEKWELEYLANAFEQRAAQTSFGRRAQLP
ncbi:hypothetical protein PtA15_8A532 [Puccinia triticina]|uniref:Uncharacterized protein n=1 Tax=Puccinia triticina TaxID=208348 RepID=A0ABY7CY32_9BASI|nr:uncharacterized protein PtA15_8A532 [Puccinia triticina]WAQ87627.1 hypothetical protein PtA15_8A532 [Puccinia triticina]